MTLCKVIKAYQRLYKCIGKSGIRWDAKCRILTTINLEAFTEKNVFKQEQNSQKFCIFKALKNGRWRNKIYFECSRTLDELNSNYICNIIVFFC